MYNVVILRWQTALGLRDTSSSGKLQLTKYGAYFESPPLDRDFEALVGIVIGEFDKKDREFYSIDRSYYYRWEFVVDRKPVKGDRLMRIRDDHFGKYPGDVSTVEDVIEDVINETNGIMFSGDRSSKHDSKNYVVILPDSPAYDSVSSKKSLSKLRLRGEEDIIRLKKRKIKLFGDD